MAISDFAGLSVAETESWIDALASHGVDAVQIRANAGDAQATANVVTKVHEFSVSYLNAFSEAAATEGATLAGNALIGADGETCGVFIEELQ